jgi:hypothetical protein
MCKPIKRGRSIQEQ